MDVLAAKSIMSLSSQESSSSTTARRASSLAGSSTLQRAARHASLTGPNPAALVAPVSGRALLETLTVARDQRFSGEVAVGREGEAMGSVVFRNGRIAWAVSKSQPEDLGTFLWRIGRVDQSQLEVIRQRYRVLGGRRKVGALLEDEGFMNRAVLRRCLLLHSRRAVSSLLSLEESEVWLNEGTLQADEELTFELAEVVPEMADERTRDLMRRQIDQQSTILAALRDIPGYRASVVLEDDGAPVAAHLEEPGVDPALIGVLLSGVVESSARAMTAAGLGPANGIVLECDAGVIVARWTDDTRKWLAAVLLQKDGNAGMAKYRLGALAPELSAGLSRAQGASIGGPQWETLPRSTRR